MPRLAMGILKYKLMKLRTSYRIQFLINQKGFCFVLHFCLFKDRVLPCSSDCVQLRDPPASASEVLGLQVYTTMPGSERTSFSVYQYILKLLLYSHKFPGVVCFLEKITLRTALFGK